MPALIQVQTTFANAEDALRVARTLVEEKLAACGQLVEGVRSVFRWEGALQESAEVLLLLKTTADLWPDLRDRLAALHPYDTPEIIAAPVGHASFEYLAWVRDSLRS